MAKKIIAENDLICHVMKDKYSNSREEALAYNKAVGDDRFNAVVEFCRAWGLVTSRPNFNDPKIIEPMPVSDVVDRAFSMVSAIYDEGQKRGWLVPVNWPEDATGQDND